MLSFDCSSPPMRFRSGPDDVKRALTGSGFSLDAVSDLMGGQRSTDAPLEARPMIMPSDGARDRGMTECRGAGEALFI